jgi:hypothetical protein
LYELIGPYWRATGIEITEWLLRPVYFQKREHARFHERRGRRRAKRDGHCDDDEGKQAFAHGGNSFVRHDAGGSLFLPPTLGRSGAGTHR